MCVPAINVVRPSIIPRCFRIVLRREMLYPGTQDFFIQGREMFYPMTQESEYEDHNLKTRELILRHETSDQRYGHV